MWLCTYIYMYICLCVSVCMYMCQYMCTHMHMYILNDRSEHRICHVHSRELLPALAPIFTCSFSSFASTGFYVPVICPALMKLNMSHQLPRVVWHPTLCPGSQTLVLVTLPCASVMWWLMMWGQSCLSSYSQLVPYQGSRCRIIGAVQSGFQLFTCTIFYQFLLIPWNVASMAQTKGKISKSSKILLWLYWWICN